MRNYGYKMLSTVSDSNQIGYYSYIVMAGLANSFEINRSKF